MRWRKTSEHSATSEDGKWHILKSLIGGREFYLLWDAQGKITKHASRDDALRVIASTSAAATPTVGTGSSSPQSATG